MSIHIAPSWLVKSELVSIGVDTGCTGELILARDLIERLPLSSNAAVRAIFAEGKELPFETFVADAEWFGAWHSMDVVANTSFPLLRVGLLPGHRLIVDSSTLTAC